MTYLVTARKWRPLIFDDVVGQSHIANTLRNAIRQNRLAHAFVFSGQRGCGKTTMARILARSVNCLHPKDENPDNTCEICTEILNGRSLDVIEIDGASNRGVDEIRNLKEAVRYTPTRGKFKVYIIDEVHMLTKEAFNALLKTLEEPPAHIIFIFATTEVHRVPATILSRCQRYDFRRITVEDIIGRLRFIAKEEKIEIDDDALMIIARKGDGSMRDAQSIFDQIVSYCGTTVKGPDVIQALNIVDQEFYFRVTDAVRAHDTTGGLAIVGDVVTNGYDLREFLSGLAEHLRNLLIVKTTGSAKLVEAADAYRNRCMTDAAFFSEQDLLRLIRLAIELDASIRYSPQPRYALEAGMIQMTKMAESVKIEELLSEIGELKRKFGSGAVPVREVRPAADSPKPVQTAPRESGFTPRPVAPKSDPPATPRASLQTAPAAPLSPQPAHPAPTAASPRNDAAALETARQLWPKLSDEVMKERVAIGSILSQSAPVEVVNGALRVASSDALGVSTLRRNQSYITDKINGALGSKLRLEFVQRAVSEPSGSSSSVSTSSSTSSSSSQPTEPNAAKPPRTSNGEEHPIMKALYRDFGAERI